jgi:hypothetical protein
MADLFGLITHPRVSSGPASFEKLQSDDAYYYPGTRIPAEAVEIEVGDGTRVEGLQFRVP